VLNFDVGELTE